MNKDNFKQEVANLGLTITDEIMEKLDTYYNFLVSENKKYNLTAIINEDDVYLKHFYDSLTITKVVDLNEQIRVLDIGTGAGFPGVIIKLFFPNIEVTLLDSNNKKISFLNLLIEKLGLKGIKAINARAEEFAQKNREVYDLVTARAVAPLNVLMELSMPLIKVGSYFLAMKGREDSDEVLLAKIAAKHLKSELLEVEKFVLPLENSERTIYKILKTDKTPIMFPREYTKIIKNPLK